MRLNGEKMSLSFRITEIITRLNAGETLSLDELEEDFGVSKRTIQRDFHEKLSFLPLAYSHEVEQLYASKLNT
jgi:predicted DNA-binding transcriptional regulator YafY